MSQTKEADLSKSEQKARLKELAVQLGVVQREAKELDLPTVVIIEALDASDKGRVLNEILLEMDSRLFKVFSTHASDVVARDYPLLWRAWNHVPKRGRVQFYDRSSYYLTLDGWAEGKIHEDDIHLGWRDIMRFERALHDDGTAIVKIFLTISQKEQARRLKKLESNPKTAWRVTAKDWMRHREYKPYMEMVRRLLEETNQPFAKWREIDANDFLPACVDMFETIIDTMGQAVEGARAARQKRPAAPAKWLPYKGPNYLAKVDLSKKLERPEYKRRLKERQAVVHDLVHEIHYHGIPVIMAFCGWDAAGKGGCIKRLLQGMDPRGFEVIPIGPPSEDERARHYLWRFWQEMPQRGHISIFDRSWYGRVLVERVEGLCSVEEWQRAYREINELEEHWTDYGAAVIKLWLHIDKDTQYERFKARQKNPYKQWKITDEDWRNREKWDLYEQAVNEMIHRTDTAHAPWTLVPANCKQYARVHVIDTFIDTLKTVLKRAGKRRL